MIDRKLTTEILRLSEFFPVVVVTGPRQSGKTTLCKNIFPNYHYIDLDDVNLRSHIAESPKEFLRQYSSGLIIDEAQVYPELFSYIKVIVDEIPAGKFVLTGSNNFLLMEKITQSLAGRVVLFHLLPLSLAEIQNCADEDTDILLFNGGFPAVWSKNIPAPDLVRNYYNTYIEPNVRQILKEKDMSKFQIFMRLCAGCTGAEFNATALSGEIGVSYHTVQEWLSILEASFVVFRLPPFYQNIGKRLVKTPKIYFYDTALVCFLLGIENLQQLNTHPLRGVVFENLIVLEFLKKRFNDGKLSNLYFYRDSSQHEVDLLQDLGNKYNAYEIKSAKSFHSNFMNNLKFLKTLLGDKLIRTALIYDGETEIQSSENGTYNFRNFDFESIEN
ncbi:MAG: ATP-binding protein [Planctomycetaceae bacterium]|jgi:predicted AAA+ superfamily ATPase|nr:ATP-binding protein [Planctomycetaceae bacterium]